MPVFHPGIGGHVRSPLSRVVADEVVALSRQHIDSSDLRCRIRTDEFHPEYGTLSWHGLLGHRIFMGETPMPFFIRCDQSQNSLSRGQEQCVAASAGEELHPSVDLTPVLLEA